MQEPNETCMAMATKFDKFLKTLTVALWTQMPFLCFLSIFSELTS